MGAEGLATASVRIAQGKQDLSGRTERRASSLQQAASSTEQLSATVRRHADDARQAEVMAAANSMSPQARQLLRGWRCSGSRTR